MWQIWCTVAVSNRRKLLAFCPFETQEEKKKKGSGRVQKYSIVITDTLTILFYLIPRQCPRVHLGRSGWRRDRIRIKYEGGDGKWTVLRVQQRKEHEQLLYAGRILIRSLARVNKGWIFIIMIIAWMWYLDGNSQKGAWEACGAKCHLFAKSAFDLRQMRTTENLDRTGGSQEHADCTPTCIQKSGIQAHNAGQSAHFLNVQIYLTLGCFLFVLQLNKQQH